MYFVFECQVLPEEVLSDFTPDPRFRMSWCTGARFEYPPPNPLQLIWVAKNEKGRRVAFYSHGPVLMKKTLVEALLDAGVDNLDTYPVVIKSPTGKPDCNEYLAVNIIGTIQAADIENSVILDAPDGILMTMFFESLAIDEKKAGGKLFFRLAESVSTIIIHQSVADIFRSKDDFGLSFVDPADFVG
jgi:hypothetical protein